LSRLRSVLVVVRSGQVRSAQYPKKTKWEINNQEPMEGHRQAIVEILVGVDTPKETTCTEENQAEVLATRMPLL
jgi:hypothetical protein